jgi:hypothetical protein
MTMPAEVRKIPINVPNTVTLFYSGRITNALRRPQDLVNRRGWMSARSRNDLVSIERVVPIVVIGPL